MGRWYAVRCAMVADAGNEIAFQPQLQDELAERGGLAMTQKRVLQNEGKQITYFLRGSVVEELVEVLHGISKLGNWSK